MSTNKSLQEKEQETLAAFAGVVILFAVLAVIFARTTPSVFGAIEDDNASEQEVDVIQVTSSPENPLELIVAEATELALTEEAIVTEESQIVVEVTAIVETEASANEHSYEPEAIARGETLYVTCAACHGPDARGIAGLGKDLAAGEFVLSSDDETIVNLVMSGRPIWDAANTTGIDMPPRGGNPTLTEADVYDIVAYLRSLQTVEDTSAPNVDTSETEIEVSDNEHSYEPEAIARGETLYVTCAACHGPDARGIAGLGKDLVAGEFVLSSDDETIVNLVISGRPIWDAANTTGIDMPPRGGNPTLTEADVYDIVAYLRSLQ